MRRPTASRAVAALPHWRRQIDDWQIRIACPPLGVSGKHCPEGSDLGGDEIKEGAHARRPLQVTVSEQIIICHQIRDIVDQADQLAVAIPLDR